MHVCIGFFASVELYYVTVCCDMSKSDIPQVFDITPLPFQVTSLDTQ